MLESPVRPVGYVAIAEPPEVGTPLRELLLHLVGIAGPALDKSILCEQGLEQARHDALTGLLGHRVFHERLELQIDSRDVVSVVLVDIDDFKQSQRRLRSPTAASPSGCR